MYHFLPHCEQCGWGVGENTLALFTDKAKTPVVILTKSGEINVQNEQYYCFKQYVHQTVYNRPMDHISHNVAEDNMFLDILLLVHNMYNKQHERPMDQIPHPSSKRIPQFVAL